MPDVMLVGSIPHNSTPEAMSMFGGPLGPHLKTIPDGEVGMRRFWISRVHFQVLALHPDLEVIQRPRRDDGIERIYPHDSSDNWNFRVRDGVERVIFGHAGWRLGYYQDALNSYHFFKFLQEKGQIPRHVRFQVSMPSAVSALPPRVFPTPGDLAKVRPGYIDAARAEVEAIIKHIPANELAIQWDCSTELQDAYGSIAGLDPATILERNIPQLREVSRDIPKEVELGFHLCFGTLGGWPRFAPDSTDKAAEMAQAIIGNMGRRVDWVHIPVLDRTDQAYYEPLSALRDSETRIYLGMIHSMESFADRYKAAKAVLPKVGVAAYCGFGRRNPDELKQILADHVTALDVMQRG
jgi:hypothetical protein